MRTPSSALPSAPKGLVDGAGSVAGTPFFGASCFAAGFFATGFAAAFFAAGFLAAAFFATFFAGVLDLACALVLAFAFLRVAIAVSPLVISCEARFAD